MKLPNPLRVKRQYEARKILNRYNSLHLDVGAGSFPIRKETKTITLDIQKEKIPDICSSMLSCPIRDNTFDIITALEIFEHFHKGQQEIFLTETKRILKPNGILIIAIPNSSSFMKIPQEIVWFIREHTTQSEYHDNKYTHTHIGLISPKQLINLLIKFDFTIISKKRLMLYDYIVVCKNS